MKTKIGWGLAACWVIGLLWNCSPGVSYEVQSPDGQLCFVLQGPASQDQAPQYSVLRGGEEAVAPSDLGLELDGKLLGPGMRVRQVSKRAIDEPYALKSGKKLSCTNRCNEAVFSFKGKGLPRFQLAVRVFDDGAAFRYIFPGKDAKEHVIGRELTEFSLPAGEAWIHPYDWNSRKKPSYEQFSKNGIPIGSPSPYEQGWAFPMLFKTGGLWTLVTEACLDGSYPATHIDNSGNGNAYRIRFPEQEEPIIPDAPEPRSTLPWRSPWRVIVTCPDLNGIFSSQVVQSLNPACVLEDTDWIRPGRATWSWWYQGGSVRSYETQKQYVDFCQEIGWEYSLIDAHWEAMDGEGVEGILRYAAQKNVGIWLWYHSGAGQKDAIMSDKTRRREEMKRISELGVKGVKVDFFDTDKQAVIALYPEILRDAADFHLMVDFHGATLPRGFERTYPNLMTTEAVRGAESLGRQEVCDRMAVHNTVLVFTRNVVGSMDYTPVTFSNKVRQGVEAQRKTTVAHQLALSVAFESGFQCFADRCEAYLSLPEGPKDFLRNVPVAWDESCLLSGYPADHAVIARRKGDAWYIGGINGLAADREFRFSLPEACAGRTIHWILDGADADSFSEQDGKVDSPEVCIPVLAEGGFVAVIQ